MFTQPAPTPPQPTLATSTSSASPASPTRTGRLRGLSYLRNYTHTHLLSRDSSGHSPTSSSRLSLSRATSYPSPTASPSGAHSISKSNIPVQSPQRQASPSAQRALTDLGDSTGTNQSTTGWLPGATYPAGQSDLRPAAVASPIAGAFGQEAVDQMAGGRTRAAAPSTAAVDVSGAEREPLIQTEAPSDTAAQATTQPTTGGSSVTLPSIRFSAHQDARAARPSLVFSPISRTLPTGSETIRVGRYSERENQPPQPANKPSAAPVGFKSKVVSRRHCEFWSQDGRWYIKDVKSSSGTFLNHIRLSQPGTESRPFPINDGDIVQLGIDFKGGEEMIFRCVKIRVELNRGWQNALNSYKYVGAPVATYVSC